MNSQQETTSPNPLNNMAFGCLGAVLIHPLLLFLGFLKGFVLGYGALKVMSATNGGSGPKMYLLDGGLNAMGNLAVYYLFVGFIVIPITSLVGCGIAIALGKQLSQRSQVENKRQNRDS